MVPPRRDEEVTVVAMSATNATAITPAAQRSAL
jgi:hypothetical protein